MGRELEVRDAHHLAVAQLLRERAEGAVAPSGDRQRLEVAVTEAVTETPVTATPGSGSGAV